MSKKTMKTHSDWKALKKKYDIPSGAVKGVDMGKAIDAYWSGLGTKPRLNAELAEKTEAIYANYISQFNKATAKLDAKKDKDKIARHEKFEKEFLDDYLGCVHAMAADFKRYQADEQTYAEELRKFFAAITKLEAGTSTLSTLQQFNQGPLRGLSALGKNVGGHDLSDIDQLCGKMGQAIGKMSATTPQAVIDKFIELATETGVAINGLAKKKGIL